MMTYRSQIDCNAVLKPLRLRLAFGDDLPGSKKLRRIPKSKQATMLAHLGLAHLGPALLAETVV